MKKPLSAILLLFMLSESNPLLGLLQHGYLQSLREEIRGHVVGYCGHGR